MGYYGISISTSGDLKCAGTDKEPCVSYINITTPKISLCFGNTINMLGFSGKIKDYELYIKVNQTSGRQYCRYGRLYLSWQHVKDDLYYCPSPTKQNDFRKQYQRCERLSSTGKTCYRKAGTVWLPLKIKGKCLDRGLNELKLVGYKPINESVKWDIKAGHAYKDPRWLGYTVDDLYVKILEVKPSLTHAKIKYLVTNPLGYAIERPNFALTFTEVSGHIMNYSTTIYKKSTKHIYKPVYKRTCKATKTENGTQERCIITKISTKTENITILEPYTKKFLKPNTTYEIEHILYYSQPAYKQPLIVDWKPFVILENTTFLQHRWSWLNTSWQYRKPVTVTGQGAGDLTDYQVKIVHNFSTEYADGKIQQYCEDLRFTYYNSTSKTETEIPYWIEECNLSANDNVTVWIKVPFIGNTSSETVYMYYGNPDAVSESNGDDVFELFDDFEGTSLDTSKWYEKTTGGGSISISNSEITITTGSGQKKSATSKDTFGLNYALRARAYLSSSDKNGEIGFRDFDTTPLAEWYGSIDDYFVARTYVDDSNSQTITPTWDKYLIFEIRRVSSASHTFYIDDELKFNSTSQIPTDELPVNIFAWHEYGYIKVDWIFVRKFSDPEPTYSIGSEESSAGDVTLYIDGQQAGGDYELGEWINITANSTGYICLNISQPGGSNIVCNFSKIYYNYTTAAYKQEFSDGSTAKNFTISDGSYDAYDDCTYAGASFAPLYPGVYGCDSDFSSYAGCTGSAGNPCIIYENRTTTRAYSYKWKAKFSGSAWFYCYDWNNQEWVYIGGYYYSSPTEIIKTLPSQCINETGLNARINMKQEVADEFYEGEALTEQEWDTKYIRFHKYDNIQDAEVTLRGYANPDLPSNVKIYVNGTLVDSIDGTIGTGNFTKTTLSDGKSQENITFYENSTIKKYINLYTDSVVNSAYINITSHWYTTYDEDNSDDCYEACDTNKTTYFECEGTAASGRYIEVWIYNYTAYAYQNVGSITCESANQKSFSINSNDWIKNNAIRVFYKMYVDVGVTCTLPPEVYWLPNDIDISGRNITVYCGPGSGPRIRMYEAWISGLNGTTSDVYVDTADSGSPYEFSWSNNFTNANGSQRIDLNTTLINAYLLNNCISTPCDVPIAFHSDTSGILEISDIEINYTLDRVLTRNITTGLRNYLLNTSYGYHNVPVSIQSDTNSIVEMYNLNISYYGSDEINITAYTSTDMESYNISVYYSGFNYSFPQTISYLEFLPKTATSKNVTPYGQTSQTPILNITPWNYDKNMTLQIRLNETVSCVNITASNSSSKSNGLLLNTTFQNLTWIEPNSGTYGIWMWADYDCTGNQWYLYQPEIILRGCCEGCVCR